MKRADFSKLISRLGFSPKEAQLIEFITLFEKWNKSINLSAARKWEDIADHVGDGAQAAAIIPVGTERLIDVGSGGGIPGALIALLRPEIQVLAIEPIHKKQSFLSAVRRELGANNFLSRACRDEELRAGADFKPFQVAISRATFSLPEWLERGALLVEPGGLVIGMEGAEQFDLPDGAERVSYGDGSKTRAFILYRP